MNTDTQRVFWNRWNQDNREIPGINQDSERRANEVEKVVKLLSKKESNILEVGCGTGWFCDRLSKYGQVTGVDLADEVVTRSQKRYPNINFISSDFITLNFRYCFDIVVVMETISYVYNQDLFVSKLADITKPGGYVVITSANRFVYERREDVGNPESNQVRNWLTINELNKLMNKSFYVIICSTFEPSGHKGILRLINSEKLNSFLSFFISFSRLKYIKELLGFGATILYVGQRYN